MQNLQCLPQPRVISVRYLSLNSVSGVRITDAAGKPVDIRDRPLDDPVRGGRLEFCAVFDRAVLADRRLRRTRARTRRVSGPGRQAALRVRGPWLSLNTSINSSDDLFAFAHDHDIEKIRKRLGVEEGTDAAEDNERIVAARVRVCPRECRRDGAFRGYSDNPAQRTRRTQEYRIP